MSDSAPADVASSPSTPDGPPVRRSGRKPGIHLLEAYALPALTVLIALFFSFYPETSSTFPTLDNLQIMLGNQVVVAIVALAALIPLIDNDWDLSIGAIAGLCAIYFADALSSGMPVVAAIGIGMLLGAAIGGFNALIITKLRVNAVIATLGTATIIEGVVQQKTSGVALVSDIPQSVINFGSGTTFGVPRPVFVAVICALFVSYLLYLTPFGRYLFALGSSPNAARLTGLSIMKLRASTFIIGGLLCGLAGVMSVARAGGADPNVGVNLTLPALAAAFLSAASIQPGRYNVGGAIVALLFLAVLNSGFNLLGAAPYVSSYVNGLALIIGVALAALAGRKLRGIDT